MEELLLGALFARQELDIVQEENVYGSVLVPEADHALKAQSVNDLVGEFLGAQVADAQCPVTLAHPGADGLHQVSLAQPDAAVQEERVVRLGRLVSHRQRGGVGELIGGANHKGLKGVAGDELVIGGVEVELRLRLLACRRLGGSRGPRVLGHELHLKIVQVERRLGVAYQRTPIAGQPLLKEQIGNPNNQKISLDSL